MSYASTSTFDASVFTAVWAPCVSALSYIFDTAIDENIINKTVKELLTCANVAARFELHDVFEKILVALCNRTMLTAKADAEATRDVYEAAVINFGRSTKAQTVIGVVHCTYLII